MKWRVRGDGKVECDCDDEMESISASKDIDEVVATLVDVHVNVASGVENDVEGSMVVEMGLNEENVDEEDNESLCSRHTQPKSNDKGLYNDE